MGKKKRGTRISLAGENSTSREGITLFRKPGAPRFIQGKNIFQAIEKGGALQLKDTIQKRKEKKGVNVTRSPFGAS